MKMSSVARFAVLALAGIAVGRAAAAAPDSLRFTNCEEQVGIVTYPAALVVPLVPKGFKLGPGKLPALTSEVSVSAEHCLIGDGPDDESDALVFVQVQPPPALIDPAISTYFVLLSAVTTNAATIATLESWGLTGAFSLGNVALSTHGLLLTPQERGLAQFGTGDYSIKMTTETFTSVMTNPGASARAFVVQDGTVIGALDAAYSDQTGRLAVGLVYQQGKGPLPLAPELVTGSHSSGFSLTLTPAAVP